MATEPRAGIVHAAKKLSGGIPGGEMLVELSSSNFETDVMSEGIALIDCWAPWCGACKEFVPVFEAAAERHPDHIFAKLNTQSEEELTKKLKVSHIPTVILFRDGLLLLRRPGYLSPEEIDEVIKTAENLDMAQVRADMDQRMSGESG
jgi:thioredoxin 1